MDVGVREDDDTSSCQKGGERERERACVAMGKMNSARLVGPTRCGALGRETGEVGLHNQATI